MVSGVFRCESCGRSWHDELPALWDEHWPECCGRVLLLGPTPMLKFWWDRGRLPVEAVEEELDVRISPVLGDHDGGAEDGDRGGDV